MQYNIPRHPYRLRKTNLRDMGYKFVPHFHYMSLEHRGYKLVHLKHYYMYADYSNGTRFALIDLSIGYIVLGCSL